jgi:hypothetical protein
MLPFMLLPPLDNLCFIIFVSNLPPYDHTPPFWHSFVAMCISLSPSFSYTIHYGVYLPFFFAYYMEDLAADLNYLFLYTFVHAASR